MRRLIIIPTFNESANILVLVRAIFQSVQNTEVLVIDDGSPDGTAQVVESLQIDYPGLHLLKRAKKSGLGSAYRNGFDWGLKEGFDEIVEMDADGSHQILDLNQMIDYKILNTKADLVIGSRWISGGKTLNWSFSRKLLSRTANLYVRIMLGMGVKDSTAGFRLYSASILSKIDLDAIKSEGYSFQIEMTRAVHNLGGTIIEVPITFRERQEGESKMSKNIVREAMFLVTVWGLKRLLRIK